MTQDIRFEMEKASALLTAAIDLMNAGRLVSISALNDKIATICALAQKAGYDRCGAFKPSMIRLNKQMEQFRAALESRYGFLTTSL